MSGFLSMCVVLVFRSLSVSVKRFLRLVDDMCACLLAACRLNFCCALPTCSSDVIKDVCLY